MVLVLGHKTLTERNPVFSATTGIMLYVQDVAAEKYFWQAAGFVILSEDSMLGFDTFTMAPAQGATTVFTVFAKEFIEQVSPEVASNVPSVLLSAPDLEALHARITGLTDTASEIVEVPMRSFNFASPSGIYFAVQQG